jgi:hypothetical protein
LGGPGSGGERYVLAMWFTCSEPHRYRNDDG